MTEIFISKAPNDAREDFVLCITCGDPVREGSVRVGFPYEADDAVDSRDDTRPEFSFLHLECWNGPDRLLMQPMRLVNLPKGTHRKLDKTSRRTVEKWMAERNKKMGFDMTLRDIKMTKEEEEQFELEKTSSARSSNKRSHARRRSRGKDSGGGDDRKAKRSHQKKGSNKKEKRKISSKKAKRESLGGVVAEEPQLYCVCRKPYNEDIAMVGCDGQCGNWFHFGCVGLKPDIDGGVSDAFYCPMCKPLQEQKNKNSAS